MPWKEQHWARERFKVDMCFACAVKMDVLCKMHVRDARKEARERSEDHLHVPAVPAL